jgi:hypothetical protein
MVMQFFLIMVPLTLAYALVLWQHRAAISKLTA